MKLNLFRALSLKLNTNQTPISDTSPPKKIKASTNAWRIAGLAKGVDNDPQEIAIDDLTVSDSDPEFLTEPNREDVQDIEAFLNHGAEDTSKGFYSFMQLKKHAKTASVKPDHLEVCRRIEKEEGTVQYDADGGPTVKEAEELADADGAIKAYWQGDAMGGATVANKAIDTDPDPEDDYDIQDDKVDINDLDENDIVTKCLRSVDTVLKGGKRSFEKGSKWQHADGSWWTNEGGKVVPYNSSGGDSSVGTTNNQSTHRGEKLDAAKVNNLKANFDSVEDMVSTPDGDEQKVTVYIDPHANEVGHPDFAPGDPADPGVLLPAVHTVVNEHGEDITDKLSSEQLNNLVAGYTDR